MGTSNSIVLFVWGLALSSLGSLWAASNHNNYQQSVRTECQLTRYPTLCIQTLSKFRSGLGFVNRNVDFLSALVNETISESNLPNESYHGFLESSSATISPEARSAVDYCKELMEMSSRRLHQALAALRQSPESHKDDIQTWLSAVITFQQSCKDTVEEHVHSDAYAAKIYDRMNYLSELGSNPLSLANRIATGAPSENRSRRRLLSGFPGWVSPSQRRLLQATGIRADATVAKDGSGNYKTVTEAIAAAPGSGRFVIHVKAGTYNERINTKKDGITLIGDGKYSTVITAGKSVGEGSTLRGSATFTISGDGFIARDIGFENAAGAASHQAVAVLVSSDRAVFFRCSIAGYQDTLYAHSLRQFYRECDIYGTVDFIFGNAAAIFQSCTMYLRRPRSGGAFNTVLANGRSDPGQNTGFSVHNSHITVASDFAAVKGSYDSYLGRPWKAYSRAVVMQTTIDGEIEPRGWVEWGGASSSTYRTLYFAEYENMGPGAATGGRVGWAGFHVIGTPEASKFTVANFIGGNSWLPSTGVTFVSGL